MASTTNLMDVPRCPPIIMLRIARIQNEKIRHLHTIQKTTSLQCFSWRFTRERACRIQGTSHCSVVLPHSKAAVVDKDQHHIKTQARQSSCYALQEYKMEKTNICTQYKRPHRCNALPGVSPGSAHAKYK